VPPAFGEMSDRDASKKRHARNKKAGSLVTFIRSSSLQEADWVSTRKFLKRGWRSDRLVEKRVGHVRG